MNDEENVDLEIFHENPSSEVEEFLLELVPSIVEACGLGRINFYIRTVSSEVESEIDPSRRMILYMDYNEPYKTAKITICPFALETFYNGDRNILKRSIIHEISHIVTFRLGELAKKRYVQKSEVDNAIEEATETVAQIIRVLLSKTEPKKFS